MTSVLVLILMIVVIGLVVAFAVKTLSSMGAPPIFINLIYLIIAIALIVFLIHVLQSGHLPSVRL